MCESTFDDPSMHCIFKAGELCMAPSMHDPSLHWSIYADGDGDENDRGETYREVEDYELGLTCWFVATSIPIAFSATVRARPGASFYY